MSGKNESYEFKNLLSSVLFDVMFTGELIRIRSGLKMLQLFRCSMAKVKAAALKQPFSFTFQNAVQNTTQPIFSIHNLL